MHLYVFLLICGVCFRLIHCTHRDDKILVRTKRGAGKNFNYDMVDFMGPRRWPVFWRECEGDRQSPIDIVQTETIYHQFKLNFLLEGCNFKGKIKNNGHAPTFTLNDKGTQISGFPYFESSVFELYNFHYHFGNHEYDGSEHAVDGRKYAGEMHMVHYNTKYDTFKNAIDKPDGLLVLAVFLEVDDFIYKDFDNFLFKHRKQLKHINGQVSTVFNPFVMLPKNKQGWFYKGSLTTPGCFQSVYWMVFKTPVVINKNTLRILRSLETSYHHDPISKFGNCRPLQKGNGRKVLRNFHYS